MERILVAVDDSVEALAAARVAATVAAAWKARLRIVTVVMDGRIDEAKRLVEHVARELQAAGVPQSAIETVVENGEPFQRILEAARTWPAELIVMGVSRPDNLRSPYVGSQTEHVLEFAACPVLVVPRPVRAGP